MRPSALSNPHCTINLSYFLRCVKIAWGRATYQDVPVRSRLFGRDRRSWAGTLGCRHSLHLLFDKFCMLAALRCNALCGHDTTCKRYARLAHSSSRSRHLIWLSGLRACIVYKRLKVRASRGCIVCVFLPWSSEVALKTEKSRVEAIAVINSIRCNQHCNIHADVVSTGTGIRAIPWPAKPAYCRLPQAGVPGHSIRYRIIQHPIQIHSGHQVLQGRDRRDFNVLCSPDKKSHICDN